MKHVSEVIEALGGQAEVGRCLDLKPSTVGEMKRRQSIPAKYFRSFVQLAKDKGIAEITLDLLADIHSEKVA